MRYKKFNTYQCPVVPVKIFRRLDTRQRHVQNLVRWTVWHNVNKLHYLNRLLWFQLLYRSFDEPLVGQHDKRPWKINDVRCVSVLNLKRIYNKMYLLLYIHLYWGLFQLGLRHGIDKHLRGRPIDSIGQGMVENTVFHCRMFVWVNKR